MHKIGWWLQFLCAAFFLCVLSLTARPGDADGEHSLDKASATALIRPMPMPLMLDNDDGDGDDGDGDDGDHDDGDDGDGDDGDHDDGDDGDGDDGDHDDGDDGDGDDGDHDDGDDGDGDDGDHDDGDDGDCEDGDGGDCDPKITPYCFGHEGCPCGNNSTEGGCANSTGFGAELSGSGSTSVSADDLVLTTVNLPPNRSGIYFMGFEQLENRPLADGLRCTGGGTFRYAALNSGPDGILEMGPGIVATSLMRFPPAGQIEAGDTWNFQCWYRDFEHGDCNALTNLSNGLAVTFVP